MYKPCNLYKRSVVYDDLGLSTEIYTLVENISVQISVGTITAVDNKVLYHTTAITGVTPYTDMSMADKYQIRDADGVVYEVESLVVARQTTLFLKVVT